MDVYQIRHRNLRDLIALEGDGGLTKVAEKLGKSQAQVSHFGGEHPIKNIGPKIARQIEAAYCKTHGWLDKDHRDDDVKLLAASQSQKHDLATMAQAVRLLHITLGILHDPLELAYEPALLAAAFQIVDAEGKEMTDAVVLDLMKRLSPVIAEVKASNADRGKTDRPGGENGRLHRIGKG